MIIPDNLRNPHPDINTYHRMLIFAFATNWRDSAGNVYEKESVPFMIIALPPEYVPTLKALFGNAYSFTQLHGGAVFSVRKGG